ncbi:hypothetical protein [Thiococcus pfennigii]|uniref:hypothetical protein n=1 Tax=Thiococcus pfennigii TaxID=1057 RepID=UPI00190601DA|nr:hypothetical protein [Thiococcus pfennigii]MBK1700198.1 hypothetical protein [Thiococcus pfennigii]
MTEDEQFELLIDWLHCDDESGRQLWFTDPDRQLGLHFHWRGEVLNRRNGYIGSTFRRDFYSKRQRHEREAIIDLELMELQKKWKEDSERAIEKTRTWANAQGHIGKTMRYRMHDALTGLANELDYPWDKDGNKTVRFDDDEQSGRAKELENDEACVNSDIELAPMCFEMLDRFRDFLIRKRRLSVLPLLTCLSQVYPACDLLDHLRRKEYRSQVVKTVKGSDRFAKVFEDCGLGKPRNTFDKHLERLRNYWAECATEIATNYEMRGEDESLSKAIDLLSAIDDIGRKPHG